MAGRSWSFVSVTQLSHLVSNVSKNEDKDGEDQDENENVEEDEDVGTSLYFEVESSKEVEVDESTSLFVVFLLNLIPSGRIWKALHMSRNLDIIEKVLCSDSVTRENLCSERNNDIMDKGLDESLSSGLNESQTGAVLACLGMLNRGAKSAVELIWGPPGTGKTKTIAYSAFYLVTDEL
ncbi:hypothetical protein M0R45_019394 [Rubus argutus]|uniref:DUF6469 domain-containing protein n=1 Tax=Rubus argutus TaxID=59490 RepID=A0AAW1X575_RUBAR